MNYPPSNKIGSMNELREKYEAARKEISSYQESATRANVSAREARRDTEIYKRDAQAASRQVSRLTQKQKAQVEIGILAGAGGTAITILYQMFHIIGFPGGSKWIEWWEHEAVYGLMVWCATVMLGWAYRATHPPPSRRAGD